MPPKPRAEHEIEAEKNNIIDAAVELVSQKGLDQFTMRSLAQKVGMSPTNIYNYFYSKDELYIHMRIRGFVLLLENLTRAVEQKENNTPVLKLKAYCTEYISFGLEHAGYYQIMLNSTDPKMLDFIGTPLEEIAVKEKNSSIRTLYYLEKLLGDCVQADDETLCVIATRIVCELHGVISLVHSRIILEIGVEQDTLMENLVNSVIREFLPG